MQAQNANGYGEWTIYLDVITVRFPVGAHPSGLVDLRLLWPEGRPNAAPRIPPSHTWEAPQPPPATTSAVGESGARTARQAELPAVLLPGNLRGEPQSDGSVLISWDAVAEAGADAFYRVARRSDADGSYRVIARRVIDADGDGRVEYRDDGGQLKPARPTATGRAS